jgi:hypothetical protein
MGQQLRRKDGRRRDRIEKEENIRDIKKEGNME